MNLWTSVRILCVSAILLCSACATTRGAWYYQSDETFDSLYFAFVYAGKMDTLENVAINKKGFDGWDCKAKPGKDDRSGSERERAIAPSQLVVLWLPRGDNWGCKVVVPTSASLELESRKTRSDDINVRVSTALPSALPEKWLECPGEQKPLSCKDYAAKTKMEQSNLEASFLECEPRSSRPPTPSLRQMRQDRPCVEETKEEASAAPQANNTYQPARNQR